MTTNKSTEKTAEHEKSHAVTKDKTQRRNHSRVILIITAILLACLAAAAAFYFWQQAENYGTQTKSVISQLQEVTAKQRQQISDLQNKMQSSQSDLQSQKELATENQQTLQRLTDLKANDNRAWMLAQINHLLKLAQYNLNFQQDIAGTITLLKSAAAQLSESNDPSTLELRQAIANNIAALQSLPPFDSADILIKLNALSLQINNLPLLTEKLTQENVAPTKTDTLSSWRKILHQSWQNLEKLIVIRHRDEPLEPLMSTEQQINLTQLIQAKISQASWAVLHRNQAVYQASLTQAQTWIKKYYAADANATTNVLNQLSQLATINLTPQLPDLANTINLSQKLLGDNKDAGK